LESINPLSNLKSIAGLLLYNNSNLSSLDGLQNIELVEGAFRIDSNEKLSSLHALSSLSSVGATMGGDLVIINCPALTTLAGLEKVSLVGNDIIIKDNSHLLNLDALLSLKQINMGSIRIINNSALINMQGLSNLKSPLRDIEIQDNNALNQSAHYPTFQARSIYGLSAIKALRH